MRPSSVQSVMVVAPSLLVAVGSSAVVAVSGACSPTACSPTACTSAAGASTWVGGGVGGAAGRAGRMSASFTVMGAFSPNPAAARARAAAVSSPAWLRML